MSIVFRTAPYSSAGPVAVVLAELEVPHERVVLDLAKGDQKKPEHLALNPNGKVPTLVVDGTPMFEALAIMQWLGDRYGVQRGMWPSADSPARLRALSWTTWGYVTYGGALQRLVQTGTDRYPELKSEVHAAAARKELNHLLDVLETELKKAPFLLGETVSIADLILACVLGYGAYCGASFDGHAAIVAWMKRVGDRPSMQSQNS